MPSSSDKRRKRVLKAVVREYVDTAEPVGSETVRVKHDFDCSPATIRNDMVELEEAGLLVQPHTSAGRVPTERGYRVYVSEFAGRSPLSDRKRRRLSAALAARTLADREFARDFVRALAELTGETVFMSLGRGPAVFAGVSNLARQPEFSQARSMFFLLRALDDIEGSVADIRRRIVDDIAVLIGGDNPFGRDVSAVTARWLTPSRDEGLVGFLGPTRMDYDDTVAVARFLRDFLSRQ